MENSRFFRSVAAAVAAAMISLHAASSIAGNMSLTLSGFLVPIEILAFSMEVTKAPATLPSPTIASFQSANFTAPESTATPMEFAKLASVQHLISAQLQILSPTTSQPLSDWTFTDVVVSGVDISHAAASNGLPLTQLSLSFNRVSYRVFAADGSVAQQTCWDLIASVAC